MVSINTMMVALLPNEDFHWCSHLGEVTEVPRSEHGHMSQELMANVRFGGVKRPARVTDVLSAEEGPVREPIEKVTRADEPGHGAEVEVGPRR